MRGITNMDGSTELHDWHSTIDGSEMGVLSMVSKSECSGGWLVHWGEPKGVCGFPRVIEDFNEEKPEQ